MTTETIWPIILIDYYSWQKKSEMYSIEDNKHLSSNQLYLYSLFYEKFLERKWASGLHSIFTIQGWRFEILPPIFVHYNFSLLQKERSRISEVSDEAIQLESRIMQIKKMLVKL